MVPGGGGPTSTILAIIDKSAAKSPTESRKQPLSLHDLRQTHIVSSTVSSQSMTLNRMFMRPAPSICTGNPCVMAKRTVLTWLPLCSMSSTGPHVLTGEFQKGVCQSGKPIARKGCYGGPPVTKGHYPHWRSGISLTTTRFSGCWTPFMRKASTSAQRHVSACSAGPMMIVCIRRSKVNLGMFIPGWLTSGSS